MPAAHCRLHRTMRTFVPAKQEFFSPLDRSKSPFHRFVAENWGPTFAHCHTSCPPAQPTPLLLTVAALRFPGTSCPPIAPLPRIALAPPATGGASGDSSKAGRFICLRQHFPAKTPSGQPISGPKRGRKPGPFLETSSLLPPPAALRLFPHNTVENFVHNVENFPLCHPVEKL